MLARLLRRLLQRRVAHGGGLGVGRAQPRLVLFLLPRGLGARGLGLVERLLDGAGPLLHLRQEGLIEEALQDEEQDQEVDDLHDQRLIHADQPTAPAMLLGGQGHGGQHQGQDRAHEPSAPRGATLKHEADSPVR